MDLTPRVEHIGGSPPPKPTLSERLLALHDEAHDLDAAAPGEIAQLAKEIGALWVAINMIGEAIDDLAERRG